MPIVTKRLVVFIGHPKTKRPFVCETTSGLKCVRFPIGHFTGCFTGRFTGRFFKGDPPGGGNFDDLLTTCYWLEYCRVQICLLIEL